MPLVLSDRQVNRLHATMRLLLATEPESKAAWARSVCAAVRDLLGVDAATLLMPDDTESLAVSDGVVTDDVLRAYMKDWHGKVEGNQLRSQRGAIAWTREEIWPADSWRRSEYYHEFCVPYRNQDSAGASAPVGNGKEVVLYITSELPSRFSPGGHEVQVLRLLQPALAAAARTLHAVPARRQFALIDASPASLALFDTSGRLLHATPSFAKLLRDDSIGPALKAAAGSLALLLLPLLRPGSRAEGGTGVVRPTRSLVTSHGRLELHATIIEDGTAGNTPMLMVVATSPQKAPDAALKRHEFGLTQREAEVAQLITEGRRNREIARALGVTEHTARRHTEAVLRKLGATSRAAVAHLVTT